MFGVFEKGRDPGGDGKYKQDPRLQTLHLSTSLSTRAQEAKKVLRISSPRYSVEAPLRFDDVSSRRAGRSPGPCPQAKYRHGGTGASPPYVLRILLPYR